MDKEEFISLHRKSREANKNYREYVDQFFTHVRNSVVIKEATKSFNQVELEKVQELRKKAEDAEHELDVFLNS